MEIQKKMAEEIGTDEDALDLYSELIETSIQYIQIRAKWSILSKAERGYEMFSGICAWSECEIREIANLMGSPIVASLKLYPAIPQD